MTLSMDKNEILKKATKARFISLKEIERMRTTSLWRNFWLKMTRGVLSVQFHLLGLPAKMMVGKFREESRPCNLTTSRICHTSLIGN